MKNDEYTKILDGKLKIVPIICKNPNLTDKTMQERESSKKEGIEWVIQKLNEPILPCGTMVDLPDCLRVFGHYAWDGIRECVLVRDYNVCRICGKPATIAHHIRPRYLNGKDHPRNLIALCDRCHEDANLQIEDGIDSIIERSISHGNPLIVKRLEREDRGIL